MKKKKNDMKGLVWSVLLIILITAFLIFFLIKSSQPKIETEISNGFELTKVGGFWHTIIKNPTLREEYNVEFRYSPSEVSDIPVQGNPNSFFNLLNINNLTGAYLTFDPTSNLSSVNLAAADISKFLNAINGVKLVAGCTKNETDSCNLRPIVTCENKKGLSMVIFVKESEDPKILMKENCLTVEGIGNDLIRAYTKLLFIWYNII